MINLDADERDKFAALAERWWDPRGPLRTLHEINDCRMAYIGERLPLAHARIADIGCGAGILCEALARAGATVTGVDAAAELIELAQAHGRQERLRIAYEVATAEAIALERAGEFDAVLCMELIEHVPDVPSLIAACAQLLRPAGMLVLSTINRTPAAYLFAVLGAEYVLSLLPRGTHDYKKFVRPSELARAARHAGLETVDVSGMAYNPLTRTARISSSLDINYFASFRRPAATDA